MEAAEALRRAAPLRSILSPAGGKRRKSALKRGGGNRSERRIRFCSEQNRENFYDLLSPAKRRFDLRWQKDVEDLKPQELGVECLAYDQRELFNDGGVDVADGGAGGGKGRGRGRGKAGGGRGRGKGKGKSKARQLRDGRGDGSDGNALEGVSPTKARAALNAAWAAEMTSELSELGFDAVPAPKPGSLFERGWCGGGSSASYARGGSRRRGGGVVLDFDAEGDALMGGGGGGGDEKGVGARRPATPSTSIGGRGGNGKGKGRGRKVDTVWLAQQLVLARRLRRRAHLVMVLDAMRERKRPRPRRGSSRDGLVVTAAANAAAAAAVDIEEEDDDDEEEDEDFDMLEGEEEEEEEHEDCYQEEDDDDDEYVEYTKRGWQRTLLAAPSMMRSEEMAEELRRWKEKLEGKTRAELEDAYAAVVLKENTSL